MSLFSKNEKRILLFTNTGHFLTHAFILIFPSLVTPLSLELNLPFEKVINISFLMYLFYGIGALPAGFLSDKIHPRFSLSIYYMGIGLSSLFVSFSSTKWQLEFALLSLGLFASMYHPIGMGLISKTIENRGMALGINGVFGSIGIAFAPFLAGIINYLVGWRYIYIIMSIPSIIMGVLVHIIKIDVKNKEVIKNEIKEDDTIKLQYFVILCISMALAGFVYRGQTLILPTYFEKKVLFLYNFVSRANYLKVEGTKTLSATILTSMVYSIGIIGQLIGGKIADKYDLRYSYLLFFTICLPFLIMMYFFNDVLLFTSSIFFILFSIGMQPVENSLVAKFTPHKWRDTGYGVKFILTFGISSTVVYPIGFFKTHFSLEATFLLFSLVIFLMIINNLILILSSKNLSVKN